MTTCLASVVTERIPAILPSRREYVHEACQTRTIMPSPHLTSTMWCCHCRQHFPLQEYRWADSGIPLST